MLVYQRVMLWSFLGHPCISDFSQVNAIARSAPPAGLRSAKMPGNHPAPRAQQQAVEPDKATNRGCDAKDAVHIIGMIISL